MFRNKKKITINKALDILEDLSSIKYNVKGSIEYQEGKQKPVTMIQASPDNMIDFIKDEFTSNPRDNYTDIEYLVKDIKIGESHKMQLEQGVLKEHQKVPYKQATIKYSVPNKFIQELESILE